MKRIKFIKDHQANKAGDIAVVDNNDAFGLIDSGVAMIAKDITSQDIKTKDIKSPFKKAK